MKAPKYYQIYRKHRNGYNLQFILHIKEAPIIILKI